MIILKSIFLNIILDSMKQRTISFATVANREVLAYFVNINFQIILLKIQSNINLV